MKHWDEYINEKSQEYFLLTYLISYFIYGASTFVIINTSMNNFTNLTMLAILLCFLIFFCLIQKGKNKLHTGESPNIFIVFLTCINIAIITTVVLFAKYKGLNLKVLYFIPVILAALNNNKLYRYTVTILCTVGILFLQYANFKTFSTAQVTFDSDIILIGILFLASWLIGGLRDIELETQEHLQTLANYDELTELANHRYFQEKLDDELQEASLQKRSISLIMADLDFFKFYNDTYGHQYGDEVLKQVGQILKQEVEGIGFAARYGGEEFVIILPGFAQQQAAQLADAISQKISTHNFYGAETQPKGRLTISCGIATYPDNAADKKELIRAADQALYQAKSISKNKIELYFNVLDEISITKVEHGMINSIKVLVSIINAKDRYTFGHSERVALYAKKIAQKIGLDEQALKRLSFAAFLHDIGKIEIQRDLLNKTSSLTSEEWEILCQHPVWGAEIIKPITALKEISPIILHHHENYDGSGYPCRIKGTEIPIEARIIRIADSFDAMTTNRPYKTAMTVEKALEELEQCAGSHFDPTLVKHFINLYKEGCFSQHTA